MKSSNLPSISIRVLILSFIYFLFILFPAVSLFAGDYSIIALNSRRGVVISDDSGNNWKECNKNLPAGVMPEKIVTDSGKNLYLITARSGIYRLEGGTGIWQEMNSADFISPAVKGQSPGFRRISAFAINDEEPYEIALATKHSIYVNGSRSKSWEKTYDNGSGYYITALAFGDGAGELYAGTSCDGIFKIINGRLTRCSKGLPGEPHSKALFFYEEISNIIINNKKFYAAMNFGRGVFSSGNSGASWDDMKFPADRESLYDIYDMKLCKNFLYVSGGPGIYRCDLKSLAWIASAVDYKSVIDDISDDKDTLSFLIIDKSQKHPPLFYKIREAGIKKEKDFTRTASGKKAVYAGAPSMGKKLAGHLAFIKANGFNAVVIDMKDDFGDICFASDNPTGREIGAVKKYMNVKQVLGAFKKDDIYVIARLVVFKDERLYRAYNNKYAIWDGKNNCPWKGNPKEFWVDPHSDFVRNYNIDIALELQKLGFDEIQFDYIRFPSDGPVDRCFYRHRESGALYKSEALCFFLKEAKARLDVPVSADVYGYNAWYRVGSQIGQDVQEFAEIVDVICPMNYSSHFGRLFYNNGSDLDRTSKIIYDGGRRSKIITSENAVIRPYLQAFNLLSPSWGPGYINCQISGSAKSGCSGFTFWNSRSDYRMVGRAVSSSTGDN